jgi:hypothetical protein
MLDFDRMPRFKNDAAEIFQMIERWSDSLQVDPKAILRQIPIAHGWCDSNPKKAPRRDILRFLFNWMKKAQQLNHLVVQPKVQTYKPPPIEGELMTAEDFRKIREVLRTPPKQFCPLCHYDVKRLNEFGICQECETTCNEV